MLKNIQEFRERQGKQAGKYQGFVTKVRLLGRMARWNGELIFRFYHKDETRKWDLHCLFSHSSRWMQQNNYELLICIQFSLPVAIVSDAYHARVNHFHQNNNVYVQYTHICIEYRSYDNQDPSFTGLSVFHSPYSSKHLVSVSWSGLICQAHLFFTSCSPIQNNSLYLFIYLYAMLVGMINLEKQCGASYYSITTKRTCSIKSDMQSILSCLVKIIMLQSQKKIGGSFKTIWLSVLPACRHIRTWSAVVINCRLWSSSWLSTVSLHLHLGFGWSLILSVPWHVVQISFTTESSPTHLTFTIICLCGIQHMKNWRMMNESDDGDIYK